MVVLMLNKFLFGVVVRLGIELIYMCSFETHCKYSDFSFNLN